MEKLDKSIKISQIFLRWINSFIDENGEYSHFTKDNIIECGISHNLVKKYINILESRGDIINCTTNGYCPKIKVITKLPCYKFLIGRDFTMDQKVLILDIIEKLNGNYSKIPTKTLDSLLDKNGNMSKLLSGIKSRGKGDLWEILNSNLMDEIKLCIHSEYLLDLTDYGYRVITNERKNKDFKCQYCGETNPSKFYSGSHITCKKCKEKIKRDKELNDLHKWLYTKSYKSARDRGLEFDLTEEYILECLEFQKYKCYYTNKPFGDDKFNVPSVDRIDNSKGYIKGNICICRGGINICKNNLSMKNFKEMITNLYNNINNF